MPSRTPFPGASVIMFAFATLRHAVDGEFVMDAYCGRCGHQGPLVAADLAKRFPVNWKLKEIERRLVCRRCLTVEPIPYPRGWRDCEIIRYTLDGRPYGWTADDLARWEAAGKRNVRRPVYDDPRELKRRARG